MTMTTHPEVTTTTAERVGTERPLWAKLGRDTLYLLTGFPIALLSFSVLVTGLSLGLGLFITLLGLPVLVVVLGIARGFAAVERWRVGQVAAEMPPAPYRPVPEDTKPCGAGSASCATHSRGWTCSTASSSCRWRSSPSRSPWSGGPAP